MKEDTERHTLDREVQETPPLDYESAPIELPGTLYITLGPDGAFKAGTCSHCVIEEQGRPARAWDGAPHHAGK